MYIASGSPRKFRGTRSSIQCPGESPHINRPTQGLKYSSSQMLPALKRGLLRIHKGPSAQRLCRLDPSLLCCTDADNCKNYEKAFDTDPKLRYFCSNSFCCFGWKVPVIGACCAEVHKCTILGIEVHDPYGL